MVVCPTPSWTLYSISNLAAFSSFDFSLWILCLNPDNQDCFFLFFNVYLPCPSCCCFPVMPPILFGLCSVPVQLLPPLPRCQGWNLTPWSLKWKTCCQTLVRASSWPAWKSTVTTQSRWSTTYLKISWCHLWRSWTERCEGVGQDFGAVLVPFDFALWLLFHSLPFEG